ncbi:MAG: MraY family glycosyltransferase [Acidobacteriota bacterium]|nr:MraY family glycosyltransferase [Acidobacteriota bacterium]MDQ7086790.1 MraY family glycosyltransferase [Acidobacteriota bacterium]
MKILVFLIAALAASGLAPLARALALRLGAEDRPGPSRKIHDRSMPRLGGLALAAAAGVAVIFAAWIGTPGGDLIREFPQPVLRLALAGLVVALVGIVDDIHNLGPWPKLAAEWIAGGLAFWAGFRIEVLDLGFASFGLGVLALPVSLLWFVTMMNALNLIDGLDGLAASQALIALGALLIHSLLHRGAVAGTLSVALAGATVGFLVHNFHPARQFLGSCGALPLGLVLAALAVGTVQGRAGLNPVLPVLAVGVPLLDIVLAVARRLRQGRSPLSADRGHLHHRLLDGGHGQTRAVLLLAALGSAFAVLGLTSELLPAPWRLAPLLPAGGLALEVTRRLGYFRSQVRATSAGDHR